MSSIYQPPSTVTGGVIQHVDHFQQRVMQDALSTATAAYWRRRAATFEWARPKAGDHNGRATRDDLRALDERCRTAAEACRRAASVAMVQEAA